MMRVSWMRWSLARSWVEWEEGGGGRREERVTQEDTECLRVMELVRGCV